jgi:hypothetical protein
MQAPPGLGGFIYGPISPEMPNYFHQQQMFNHGQVACSGSYMAPSHQPGISQIAAIYKLRSRQTCDQNEMDVAAAGRSVVVAEMFGVTPAEVRNIW